MAQVPRATAEADTPAFVHEVWTVEDGLPVNSINLVLQSRTGYVWAATHDGLVRFDGVRFTVYHTGNTDGLPSSRIVDLLESRDGSLWLRTEQLHLVRFRNGRFTNFDLTRGLDAGVYELHEDARGRIWVGTAQGVGVIRDDRFAPVGSAVIRHPVSVIRHRRDGSVWVGTSGGGLYRVDAAAASAAAVPIGDGAADKTIVALYEDPAGTLWIGTLRGAYRYREDEGVTPVARDLLPAEPVLDFLADPKTGTVWILGQNSMHRLDEHGLTLLDRRYRQVFQRGLMQFDSAGALWYVTGSALYRNEQRAYALGVDRPGDPLPATTISSFVVDHEGSYWLGTHAAGLHRLKPAVVTVYSEPEGVSYRNIYPVYEDRSGDIWLGTWGAGLSRIADGNIRNYRPRDDVPPLVRTIVQASDGALWIGTHAESVLRCTVPSVRCSRLPALPPQATVFALYRDSRDDIWVGSDAGVYRYANGEWSRFTAENDAPDAPVRAFLETRDGALWMGSNGGGVSRFHDGRFTHITVADGLPSNLVRALHQGSAGFLWIGLEGHGLARLDPRAWATARGAPSNARRIASVRTSDGLFDDVIHQILEDDFGRFWMSSNRGIFWVRGDTLRAFVNGVLPRIHSTGYTERDGLRNREANGGIQPAGIRARDGRLWFPTQDGVAVIDPAYIQQNRVPPRVVVEQVTAGAAILRADAAPLRLRADQRDLEIAYTALSFVAPENMRFRYRLEGYDRDWIDAGNRRVAFYTRVPPGRYTFRVVASNNEGVWNEAGAALELVLAPRFFETTAFRVATVLTLIMLALLAFRLREQRARAQRQELRRQVDEQTRELRDREHQLEVQNAQLESQAHALTSLDRARARFFANVSHEFRTPLTLTIGPLEDALNRAGGALDRGITRQLDMSLRNARRLLRLVNQILDVAKIEAGHMTLRASRGDLVTFVRGIAAAFAPVADQKRIHFTVTAEPARIDVWFDSDALEKVFTNLLSNAFKFTPDDGHIDVVMQADWQERVAVVRITDTGPGIAPEDAGHVFERFFQAVTSSARLQPGTGIGLSLAKELIELHGGRVRLVTEPGAGASFSVELPLGTAHLRPDQITADERMTPVGAATVHDADVALAESDADERSQDIPTLLVIDDNEDMRAYVRAHFEPRYRIEEAGDGQEGLAKAQRLLPDLVISDIMMPGLDGYALGRALRENADTDFIPIILLTAMATSEQRITGLETGADDYMVKPFEMRELEARVENLIASRRRLRERTTRPAPELPSLGADQAHATPADAALLERVRAVIDAHLHDGEFGVAELAKEVYLDRSHLYRRIRELLGETPSDLIRRLRLERAAALLAENAGSVAEVAYATGFNSVSYFCQSFREAYHTTPASYRELVRR